jgi:site-specific DNA recombinase
MKAAIYSRKSVFTGKGESIENQIQLCLDYVKNHYGITEKDIYIYEDEGFSGGNIDRPQFKQLIADAKSKKFDILVCYRLDRVSRNIGDFSNLIDDLQKYNISFVSIREQFDTSTPMGRAMMFIASVFAQLERETIAERVKDNMLELAKTGRWLGGIPALGFDSENISYLDEELKERKMSKLIPNKEELKIINVIYDKYLETGSITQVVAHMYTTNFTGKHGKEFSASTISKILRNPIYVKSTDTILDYLSKRGITVTGEGNGCGLLTYNKKSKGVKKKEGEWIAAVTNSKGVIDANKWLLVQELLDKNKDNTKQLRLGSSKKGLLTGLIRCAKCGSPMRVAYGRNYHYYTCTKKANSKGVACDNKNVRGNHIEQVVVDSIINIDTNMLLEGLNESQPSVTSKENELKDIQDKIKTKKHQLNGLLDKLIEFDSDVADILKDRINDLGKEIKELNAQYDGILNDVDVNKKDSRNVEIVVNAINEFKEYFNIIDDYQKKKFMLSIAIEKITYDSDTDVVDIDLWGSKKK